MYLKHLILYFFTYFTLATGFVEFRISGGNTVEDPSEYPFIVSVRIDNYHMCGGAILTERYVVTAAHCFYRDGVLFPIEVVTAIAGTVYLTPLPSYAQQKRIKKRIIHTKYVDQKCPNDVALLKIYGKWTWADNVRSIELSDGNLSSICQVCGWGKISSDDSFDFIPKLQAVEVAFINETACEKSGGELFVPNIGLLCAGKGEGKDACMGDSGGPLLCGPRLDGIVVCGLACGEFPGIYLNVSHHKSWIIDTINSTASSKVQPHFIFLIFFVVIKTFL